MSTTITAQMAQRTDRNGRKTWRLYVCLMGESHWPEHVFRGAQVPTVAQRAAALASLGYAVALPDNADGSWNWCETSARHDDLSSPVTLIASVPVRPACEESSGARLAPAVTA